MATNTPITSSVEMMMFIVALLSVIIIVAAGQYFHNPHTMIDLASQGAPSPKTPTQAPLQPRALQSASLAPACLELSKNRKAKAVFMVQG